MNLNSIIYTAADYKIGLSYNGVTVPLSIVEEVDYGAKKESEYIHIIGSEEPVGLKTNTSTYPGKLTIEVGELELLLTATGLVFGTQISNATISIIALTGVMIKVINGVVFTTDDRSIKAKDKRSLTTLSFESLGATGT